MFPLEVIIYVQDLSALQAWMYQNRNNYPEFIAAKGDGIFGSLMENKEYCHLRFVDKIMVYEQFIENQLPNKSLALCYVRNQDLLDAFSAAPVEVLASGHCKVEGDCPFDKIEGDALNKYNQVWTPEMQAVDGFKFGVFA